MRQPPRMAGIEPDLPQQRRDAVLRRRDLREAVDHHAIGDLRPDR